MTKKIKQEFREKLGLRFYEEEQKQKEKVA